MRGYLDMVSRYQRANPVKTRLTVISVAISVALVTAIFSMMDVFQRMEMIQVINANGMYHIWIDDACAEERAAIEARVDVQNSGEWFTFEMGTIDGVACKLAAVDERFAANMHVAVIEGRYPTSADEVMLERWALEAFRPPRAIGDSVIVRFANGEEHVYTISGLFSDLAATKAEAVPGVILSMEGARAVGADRMSSFLIEFKSGVYVPQARQAIQGSLLISDERIVQNEKLLTVMGQSRHESALGLYSMAVVLFTIVLIAGVVMIYNVFSISVMERVRQFGMLRCIGASKAQIRSIVRCEGLRIAGWAVPLGVLAGCLVTFAGSALLKFYNDELFAEMPLFVVSLPGIAAGVAVGFATVLIAAFVPARRAAAVSPAGAVSGGGEALPLAKRKGSRLTRVFPVEVALGVSNALARKRTLLLMAASLALSIILFLGFSVFVEFLRTSMKTTKPYTPDVSILSDKGLTTELYQRVGALEGVDRVYGRMFGYVSASFDASLLTQTYLDTVGGVEVLDNGRFVPVEKSWLISYDADQLAWSDGDLIAGTLDEAALDAGDGIIAVHINLRDNIASYPASWSLGDRVMVETPSGPREKTVMAILRSVPFSDSSLNMAVFVTTESQYTEMTGESTLKVIDVQLKERGQEQTIAEMRRMLAGDTSLQDRRQENAEIDQAYFSMAVCVYGFVAVIAVIGVLNVVSTMRASVVAKTRYLGVMRAVGMTGGQLNRMVLAEAACYNLLGCLLGIGLGVPLQRQLTTHGLAFAHMRWTLPLSEIGVIVALACLVTAVSVIEPLRLIRRRGIVEVLRSL